MPMVTAVCSKGAKLGLLLSAACASPALKQQLCATWHAAQEYKMQTAYCVLCLLARSVSLQKLNKLSVYVSVEELFS